MAASVHRPNRPGVAPDKAPDLAPGGRKRDTPLFLILAFLSLNAVLLVVVDRTVREPYMDEEFHIPQAQRYCEAFPPDFYHPDISTPPGLYWASALLARSLSTVLSFPASLLSKHFPPSSHARAKTRARREENEEPRSEDGARDEARDLPFLCRRFSLRAFGALFVSPLTLLLLWNLALRMHFSQEQPRKERRETPAACEPSRETQRLETSPRASNGQEDEGERGTAGSFSHGVESPAGFFASGSHASRSESAERRTPRPSRRALLLHLRVARIALLPTFYFFNFLFYTDCLSVMLLLFAYHQLLTCAHLWGLAAAGSLAFFVRQTAIVWSGGACLFAFLAALACRPASAREPQEKQTRMQGTQRHFSGKGRTPRGVSAARDKDEKTKAVEEKAQRGLCRGPALQRQALFGPVSVLTWENVKAVIVFFLSPRTLVDVSLPLALPLIAFFFFVVSNGGRVAVGHHAYHSPSVHTASLLYAALFVATAASPASLLSALRVVVSLAKSVFFAKSPFSLIPLGLSVFPSEKPSSKGPAKAGNAGNGETRVKAGKLKDGGEARELDAVCPRHAPLRKNGLRASRAAPADCDGPFRFTRFFTCFLCFSVAAGLGAFAHPFVLSDNRHFVFYLWRYLFRLPSFRWILGPLVASLFLVCGDVPSSLVAPPLPAWILPQRQRGRRETRASDGGNGAGQAGGRDGEETEFDGGRRQGASVTGIALCCGGQTSAELCTAPHSFGLCGSGCQRSFYTSACLCTYLVCCCLALVPSSLIEPRYFQFLLVLFVLHERFPSRSRSRFQTGQEDGGERDKQERPAGSGDELAGCTDTVEASGGGCVKQRLGRTGEMRMKTDSTVLERRAGSADTAEGLGDNRHSKPRGNLQRVNPFCEPFRCLFSLDCWVNLWSGKNIGEREDLANEAAALVLNGGVSAVIFYVFLCRPFIDYAGNVARFML
uniref:Dol-P-Glc:Glc(2)Man(9)GlcNAc(2)-PP-Dol alpha-1,2-glucosyltransferase n=1 Tax=Neospora caninum (strain Liverpool) TaxID=572307 RepID=A0A0F7UDD6_NEOCL|nr:TPA: Putative alpha-1,2-glucosyltransferase [Neospora caninum Liverpool]